MAQVDVAGVDIGGTKTHLRVRLIDGRVADRVASTESWRPVEQERDAGPLLDLLSLCGEITSDTRVAIGAHGCDTRGQCEEFAADLRAHSVGDFIVVNDAELLVPAAGLDEGIGIVVGTGSIVVGHDRAGELLTAGGWGWILGDPGSAPALVRESARAVLADHDRGLRPGILAGRLFDAYGVHNAMELGYVLTAARRITEWSEYAPVVFDAARAGSTKARTVIQHAAEALTESVLTLRRRGARGSDAVVGGGVITAQRQFGDELIRLLRHAEPGLRVQILRTDPVGGALVLASKRQTEFTLHNTVHKHNTVHTAQHCVTRVSERPGSRLGSRRNQA